MIEIDPKKELGRILPKEINNLTNFKYYNYLLMSLKLMPEEVNFIVYQYLIESGKLSF